VLDVLDNALAVLERDERSIMELLSLPSETFAVRLSPFLSPFFPFAF
jgi:hypothetical protein